MTVTTVGICNGGQQLSIQSDQYRPKHWTL